MIPIQTIKVLENNERWHNTTNQLIVELHGKYIIRYCYTLEVLKTNPLTSLNLKKMPFGSLW